MSEETEQQNEEQLEQSIWELLELDEPESDGEEEQEEMDEEIAKEDKFEKKMSAKMENMQKKFDNTILRERIGKFQDTADDLEKDLFKTIASDVKNPEDFDKAVKLVHERAIKMREEADKYRAQMEEQAKQQAASAWGSGPIGTPVKKNADYEDEIKAKIAKGDTHAALAALLEGDKMVGDVF